MENNRILRSGEFLVHEIESKDIFIPEEYLRRWFVEDHEFWNEQYMLYTFLQYNQAFKVLWAGNYMRLHHPELLMHSFPSYQRDTVVPGSFWIQKVA